MSLRVYSTSMELAVHRPAICLLSHAQMKVVQAPTIYTDCQIVVVSPLLMYEYLLSRAGGCIELKASRRVEPTEVGVRPVGVWCCLCLAIVLAVLAFAERADATVPGWSQATVTRHGVKLTLSIRRQTYPQSALVRVWARVQNVTAHNVLLYDQGPEAAGKYIPQPVVSKTREGTPLPISLTDYRSPSGPAPLSLLLPAGAVRNVPEMVILRGPFLRLDLTLSSGRHHPARPGSMLSTPTLRLNLIAPDTPTVTLHTPPAQPSATVAPTVDVHGNLLGVWNWNCGNDIFPDAKQQNLYWAPVGSRITPTCTSLLGWHEIVGWLNHPVAEIDWGEQ